MSHQARRISCIASSLLLLLLSYILLLIGLIQHMSFVSPSSFLCIILHRNAFSSARTFLCYRLAYVLPRSVRSPSLLKKFAHSLPSSKAPFANRVRQ